MSRDLHRAVKRWAWGDRGAWAAVHLLIENGDVLDRMDRAGFVRWLGDNDAAPLFRQAVESVGDSEGGAMYLSGSQAAMLRIAASLAGKAPVNLWNEMGRFDHANQRVLLRNFARFYEDPVRPDDAPGAGR